MKAAAALDVGGTKIAAGLVREGQVLARSELLSAPLAGDYDLALERMSSALRGLLVETGCELEGIGVGLSGRLEAGGRRIGRNDFLPAWQGRDLAGDLERMLGVPAGIENDADAAALAEAKWGAGRGSQRFIYVTVSTGIGGGIVLDGRLYRGLGGAHPEIGHHVIDPSGPACYCGARGCWERMASGAAVLDWARENFPEAARLEALDARQIFDLAGAGCAWAVEAARREGRWLGVGLANLVTLFAPDCIALGGGVMRRWSLLEPLALEVVRARGRLLPVEHVRILPAQLGGDAPLLGAGLSQGRFFQT